MFHPTLPSNKKMLKKVIALSLVILILPLALGVMKLRTNLAPKADVSAEASWLNLNPNGLTANNKENQGTILSMGIGQEMEVDVFLVNDSDLAHVVTGIDAILTYDKNALEAVKVESGEIFESLTQQKIDQDRGRIEISGAFSKIKDDAGNPVGYAANGGSFAKVTFKAKKIGDTKVSLVYNGGQDTSDSNIIAFKKGQPVSGQMPVERFLQRPGDLNFEVVEKIAQSPVPSPTIIDGPPERPTPSPIVIDGPPERPTPSPIVIDGPPERPTPSPMPRPAAQLQLQLSMLDRVQIEANMFGARNDAVSRKNMSDFITKGVLYGIQAGQVKGVAIASALGDLNDEFEMRRIISPTERPEVKQIIIDGPPENPNPNWKKIVIDGPPERPVPSPIVIDGPPERPGLVKLAEFTTDIHGLATVSIPDEYQGKRMQLFVRTPSHLRKVASGGIVALPFVPKCYPMCGMPMQLQTILFNNLVPGDIFIASGESEQDNIINTFDAIELIKSLGESSLEGRPQFVQCLKEPCVQPEPVFVNHRADLNGDDVVNTRDLKILLQHMGKRGDEPISSMSATVSCDGNEDCQPWQTCSFPTPPSCPNGADCMRAVPIGRCVDGLD